MKTINGRDLKSVISKCQQELKASGNGRKVSRKHGISEHDQNVITEAYFTEFESWTRIPGNEVPCGAPLEDVEDHLKKGNAIVIARLQENPPAGIDPVTIAALMGITYYLYKFFHWIFGDDDE